ncbi:MAG: cytochrome c biogenesis protein CcsA [Candidatus Methanospirareceae archaeon]
MDIGEILLILAGVLLLSDSITLSLRARTKGRRDWLSFAPIMGCILIIASYFRLTIAFLTDDFRLREVYEYSSSGLSIQYKLGGPWVGASGSMLFITFLFAVIYFVYRFKGGGWREEKEGVSRIASYRILDIFIAFFILLTLFKSPFEQLPITPSEGYGLNPLLQTTWTLIHPPVVFLGYAFVFFAFSIMLARMKVGRMEGSVYNKDVSVGRTLRTSLFVAWLFLSLGIALGGWWSYEVLGWGGYWAWDPVETASLLPWLALTAYFHIPPSNKDLSRETMLAIAFFMVIFATSLTRGGLLESVHAFGSSQVGPAAMLFAFSAVIYFFYLARRTRRPFYTFNLRFSLYPLSILIVFWSLVFLLIICFLGVALPIIGGVFVGNRVSISAEFYNKWCFPFTLAFVAALIGCNNKRLNIGKYAGLIAFLICLGLILVNLRIPTSNPLANFGLPILIATGTIIIYNFLQSIPRRGLDWGLCGKALLHLAIIVILIGVFVSSTTGEESKGIITKPHSTVEVLGTKITFDDVSIYRSSRSVYKFWHHLMPECSAMGVRATIERGGKIYYGNLRMYYYPNHGIVSKPLIISTPKEDIYMYIEQTPSSFNSLYLALMGKRIQPVDFKISVRIIPLVSFVWVGIILLTLGAIILIMEKEEFLRD